MLRISVSATLPPPPPPPTFSSRYCVALHWVVLPSIVFSFVSFHSLRFPSPSPTLSTSADYALLNDYLYKRNHVVSRRVVSRHVMSYEPWRVIWCSVMPCHARSCHVMSGHAMPCHPVPCPTASSQHRGAKTPREPAALAEGGLNIS